MFIVYFWCILIVQGLPCIPDSLLRINPLL